MQLTVNMATESPDEPEQLDSSMLDYSWFCCEPGFCVRNPRNHLQTANARQRSDASGESVCGGKHPRARRFISLKLSDVLLGPSLAGFRRTFAARRSDAVNWVTERKQWRHNRSTHTLNWLQTAFLIKIQLKQLADRQKAHLQPRTDDRCGDRWEPEVTTGQQGGGGASRRIQDEVLTSQFMCQTAELFLTSNMWQ